jgi:hypothetical protein
VSIRVAARGGLAVCAMAAIACGAHAADRAQTAQHGGAGAQHGGAGAQQGAAGTQQGAAGGQPGVPGADWTRFDYDAQRSGVGPVTTGITAANVGRLQRRVVRLDGVADSSPVEFHGVMVAGARRDVVVLTTTYGRTVAIDPGSGARLWEYTPRDLAAYEGGPQITTASPIVDPTRAYVYAATPDGLIHKLRLASGREVRSGGWPVRVTFDPRREKIASALNIVGPLLLVTTGGYYGDAPTYQGHVVEVERSSGRIAAVWNSLCSNRRHLLDPPSSCPASDSAIWARAGAVVEPGARRILLATGNGPFNGVTDWGDSVLELSVGGLHLLHNWTPVDQAQLNAGDTDLGSTAPALLPPVGGRRLVVQGGKDGRLHLLDLNRLDGTRGPAGPRLGGELADIPAPGSGEVLTAPAVWQHARHAYLFVADDEGTAAYLAHGGRRPGLHELWGSDHAGTSPVLAGGLLYVYDERAGALRVYSPLTGRELAALAAAPGHWSSPIVVGGRVILPTGGSTADNAAGSELFIYHLPGR